MEKTLIFARELSVDQISIQEELIEQCNQKHSQDNQTYVEENKIKKRILISVLFSLCMIQTLFLNVSSFLPLFVVQYHSKLNSTMVSLVLIMFEISGFLASPIIGGNLTTIGRKNMIIYGYIVMIISTAGFGVNALIISDTGFLVMEIISRFIQGIGNFMVQTSCYSIITYYFSENREKYLGLSEAASGLGLMLGPVIGSLIYAQLHFMNTFIVFTIILIINLIIISFALPNSLNTSFQQSEKDMTESPTPLQQELSLMNDKQQQQSNCIPFVADNQQQINLLEENQQYNDDFCNDYEEITQKITYSMFFFNKRCFFSYITCSIIGIYSSFMFGFLSLVLQEYGLTESTVGYIFAIPCLTYAISSLCVSHLLSKLPRRLFLFFAFILCSVALFLLGPSELLPNKLWILLIGYATNGIAQGLIYIPLLPEIIQSVQHKENIVEGQKELVDMQISDKASGLYGTFYSVGQIISPLLGSALYDTIGFRGTCDLMALSCAFYTSIFFIFNVGFGIFGDEKKFKEELELLKLQEKVVDQEENIENYDMEEYGEEDYDQCKDEDEEEKKRSFSQEISYQYKSQKEEQEVGCKEMQRIKKKIEDNETIGLQSKDDKTYSSTRGTTLENQSRFQSNRR